MQCTSDALGAMKAAISWITIFRCWHRREEPSFKRNPVLDHVPKYFLDWLKRQDLHPSELIAILTRSLEIGFDAVMHDPVPLGPAAAPEIHDPVPIRSVALTAYDALCGQRKGDEYMSIVAINEQIRLYVKQLKIPTFAEYEQVLRQADSQLGLPELLLELMKAEYETRHTKQYHRRLKAAGFPYQKPLEEFDFS